MVAVDEALTEKGRKKQEPPAKEVVKLVPPATSLQKQMGALAEDAYGIADSTAASRGRFVGEVGRVEAGRRRVGPESVPRRRFDAGRAAAAGSRPPRLRP